MIYTKQIQVPDLPAYTNRKFLLRRKVYKLACALSPLDPEIWIDFRKFLQTTPLKNYNPGWDYLVPFSGNATINTWDLQPQPVLVVDLYEADRNFYVGGATFIADLLHDWWARGISQKNPPKADVILWRPGQPDLVLQEAVLYAKEAVERRDPYPDRTHINTKCFFVGERIYHIGGWT